MLQMTQTIHPRRLLYLSHRLKHREGLLLHGDLKLTEKLRQAVHHGHPLALHDKSDVVVWTTHDRGTRESKKRKTSTPRYLSLWATWRARNKSTATPTSRWDVHHHPRRPVACRSQKQDGLEVRTGTKGSTAKTEVPTWNF